MNSHTPGPWTPDHSSDARSRGYVRTADRIAVCRVTETGRKHSEAAANASLISAAPDLLVALKLALCASEGDRKNGQSWDKVARAAIAKAEGR